MSATATVAYGKRTPGRNPTLRSFSRSIESRQRHSSLQVNDISSERRRPGPLGDTAAVFRANARRARDNPN